MTPTDIERVCTEDDRFYRVKKDDGTELYLPSVTTILSHVKVDSFFLDTWKEEQAEKLGTLGARIQLFLDAHRGTQVHAAIERWVRGEALDWKKDGYDQDEWARIARFMQWAEDTQPAFRGSEMLLWSESFRYAGTSDGLIERGGKAYIIDYKTGKDVHDSHKIQAAAYVKAYAEMAGTHVDGAIILALNARTRCGYKEVVLEEGDLAYYWDGFLRHLALFEWAHAEFTPKRDLLPARFPARS